MRHKIWGVGFTVVEPLQPQLLFCQIFDFKIVDEHSFTRTDIGTILLVLIIVQFIPCVGVEY